MNVYRTVYLRRLMCAKPAFATTALPTKPNDDPRALARNYDVLKTCFKRSTVLRHLADVGLHTEFWFPKKPIS